MVNFKRLNFKSGLKDAIPIALAYFAVSFSFGVSASSLGVPEWISTLMSTTNLTSAGQQAGVIIIAGLGTIVEILITQLVINARYFLMSLSLSQKLDKKFTLLDKCLIAFGITDEIFAVAVSNKNELTKQYFTGLIFLPWLSWTLGTLFGAVLGGLLPVFIVNALTIAIYAMFISIVLPAVFTNIKILPIILISAGLSCLFFFIDFLEPLKDVSCVICALIASIVGAILFPISEEEVGDNE